MSKTTSVIISIILTALIVGGGTYYIAKSTQKKVETTPAATPTSVTVDNRQPREIVQSFIDLLLKDPVANQSQLRELLTPEAETIFDDYKTFALFLGIQDLPSKIEITSVSQAAFGIEKLEHVAFVETEWNFTPSMHQTFVLLKTDRGWRINKIIQGG